MATVVNVEIFCAAWLKSLHYVYYTWVCNTSFLSLLRLVRFWSIEERAPQAIAPLPNGLCCAFSTEGSVLSAGWDTETCSDTHHPEQTAHITLPQCHFIYSCLKIEEPGKPVLHVLSQLTVTIGRLYECLKFSTELTVLMILQSN